MPGESTTDAAASTGGTGYGVTETAFDQVRYLAADGETLTDARAQALHVPTQPAAEMLARLWATRYARLAPWYRYDAVALLVR